MRQVTKEEFFAFIGNRNISPNIINNYERKGRGYIQEWKDTSGRIYGKTHTGDFPFTEKEYFIN